MKRLVTFAMLATLLGSLAIPAQSAAAQYTSPCVDYDARDASGLTRRGGSGSQVLLGSPGDDVLRGNSGNDVLCGFGGNDRLIGGSGNDVIDGGGGEDVLRGNSGNDLLLNGERNRPGSGSDEIGTTVGAGCAKAQTYDAFSELPDLSGLDLTNCDLSGISLDEANLEDAILTGANLRGTLLHGAILIDANLEDADLTNAILLEATLTGVIWDNTICPDGTNSDNNDGNTCLNNLDPNP